MLYTKLPCQSFIINMFVWHGGFLKVDRNGSLKRKKKEKNVLSLFWGKKSSHLKSSMWSFPPSPTELFLNLLLRL